MSLGCWYKMKDHTAKIKKEEEGIIMESNLALYVTDLTIMY